MHANNAQITVRAKGKRMTIRTFLCRKMRPPRCSNSSTRAAINRRQGTVTTTLLRNSDQVQGKPRSLFDSRSGNIFACLAVPDGFYPSIKQTDSTHSQIMR